MNNDSYNRIKLSSRFKKIQIDRSLLKSKSINYNENDSLFSLSSNNKLSNDDESASKKRNRNTTTFIFYPLKEFIEITIQEIEDYLIGNENKNSKIDYVFAMIQDSTNELLSTNDSSSFKTNICK